MTTETLTDCPVAHCVPSTQQGTWYTLGTNFKCLLKKWRIERCLEWQIKNFQKGARVAVWLDGISGHLPNIYHLFFPSWTPVLLTTTYPGSRTLHLQTPFRYRCPHDLVSPMKCTWTHWISLLGKSNKGGWSIVALSESSTNNFVYHKLPFLLPFFPIMWAWCWRSFSHLGTTGSKQMLGILERTKVPESMMT